MIHVCLVQCIVPDVSGRAHHSYTSTYDTHQKHTHTHNFINLNLLEECVVFFTVFDGMMFNIGYAFRLFGSKFVKRNCTVRVVVALLLTRTAL